MVVVFFVVFLFNFILLFYLTFLIKFILLHESVSVQQSLIKYNCWERFKFHTFCEQVLVSQILCFRCKAKLFYHKTLRRKYEGFFDWCCIFFEWLTAKEKREVSQFWKSREWTHTLNSMVGSIYKMRCIQDIAHNIVQF